MSGGAQANGDRFAPRTFVGVAIAEQLSGAVAVRIEAIGRGLEARTELLAGAVADVPAELVELYRELANGRSSVNGLALLAAGLAGIQAALIREVAPSDDEPLAVGVIDPGVWQFVDELPQSCLSLCDSALLAEISGLSVIDAFPARDLAQGGRGGPLDVLPLWMLLHDAKRPRVLLDRISDARVPSACAPHARLIYLPASCEASGAQRVACYDLAGGDKDVTDESIAVQLADCVRNRLPKSASAPQFVLLDVENESDREQLRIQLDELLPEARLVSVAEIGIPYAWLSAGCAAALALLHVDQVPAALPIFTGGTAPRVVGRLTPGSPANWRRLAKELADNQPQRMSLRSAM